MRRCLLFLFVTCLPLFGEDRLVVVSADPKENVLLEVTCDGPRRLEMSSDLEEWVPVAGFLPQLDRFRMEAPQYTRKVTYFRLVDISSHPLVFETDKSLPEIEGRSFGTNLGLRSGQLDVIFGENGRGFLNTVADAGPYFENCTYEVIDRQPGVVSLRLAVADGTRHGLTLVFPAEPLGLESGYDYVAFISRVIRYKNFYSSAVTPSLDDLVRFPWYGWHDLFFEYEKLPWGPQFTPPEVPPPNVTGGTLSLNPEQKDEVMIEILSPTQGRWIEDSTFKEIVSLEFYRTGLIRHTCLITRGGGTSILTKDWGSRMGGFAMTLPPGARDYPFPGEVWNWQRTRFSSSRLELP